MTHRSLERRIRRLELVSTARSINEAVIILVVAPDRDPEQGERVVVDGFRDVGNIVWGRERITAEPNDNGHRCERHGYLADVLAQIHEQCPWRETGGVCRMCHGTPIAESPSETQESDNDQT